MSYFAHRRKPFCVLLWFISSIFIFSTIFSFSALHANAEDHTVNLVHYHRGSSSEGGGCYNTPVYHEHSGSSSGGGKCYSPIYHSHSSSCVGTGTCNMTPSSLSTSYSTGYCNTHGTTGLVSYTVTYKHSACGAGGSTSTITVCSICGGGNIGPTTHTYTYNKCGMSTSSIIGYTLSCGKAAGVSIDGYETDCGLENGQSCGSFSVAANNTAWTRDNVTLTGSVDDLSGLISSGGSSIITFTTDNGTICEDSGSSVTVSENGVYYAHLALNSDLFDSADGEIMYTVSNIDRTDPQISEISYDTGAGFCKTNPITVNAADLQPDGSEGSGICGSAYSFDDGSTWQDSNEYEATSNGTYTILVRDAVGNTSSETITISNVDDTPPTLTYKKTPDPWYSSGGSDRTYIFTAVDDEGGLDPLPYSYDGGETWTDGDTLIRTAPGDFTVLVRDIFGNTTELTLSNEYDTPPSSGGDDGGSGNGSDPSVPDIPSYPVPGTDTGSDDNDDDDDSDSEKTDPSSLIPLLYAASPEETHSGDGTSSSASASVSDATASDDGPHLIRSTATPKISEDAQNISLSENSTASPTAPSESIRIPIYKTTGFKVAASATGTLLCLSLLGFIFLLMYAGIRVYSYDGSKYRFLAIVSLRSGARGRYVDFSERLTGRAPTTRYRLVMGPVFVHRFKNELIYIHRKSSWIPFKTDHEVIVDIPETP